MMYQILESRCIFNWPCYRRECYLNNVSTHIPATIFFSLPVLFSSVLRTTKPLKNTYVKIYIYHLSIVPGSCAFYPSRQPAVLLSPTFPPLLTINPVISILCMFSREILGRRSGVKRMSAINRFLPREAIPAV